MLIVVSLVCLILNVMAIGVNLFQLPKVDIPLLIFNTFSVLVLSAAMAYYYGF